MTDYFSKMNEDYIHKHFPDGSVFKGAMKTVMRVDSLKACCFGDYTYYINTGKRNKKIHSLAIFLIASNGVSVLSDTTEEAGQALMALLKQRNSTIDTNEGKVLPESAFDSYKNRVLGAR